MDGQLPAFRLRGLTVGYGPRPVLEDVHLEVFPGEFWFFLGPNGEGKTTLLKTLLGALKPLRGEIEWHPGFADRRQWGFVPQRCDFNPTLPITVREFVRLGLVGIRCGPTERRIRLAEALAAAGLNGLAGRSYWSLSGGQRQRALVARALVRRPTLLGVDEPTTGLDLAAEEVLLESLVAFNRSQRLTVLFVTHDLVTAARHASHVALFHGGQVRSGAAETVLSEANLGTTYGVPVTICREAAGMLTVHVRREEADR
jgi:ABC-type Mn2+/Zn2+ transport system ATPase subunit